MKLTTLMYAEGLFRENAERGNPFEKRRFIEMADEFKQIIKEAEGQESVFVHFRLENDLKRPKIWEET